MKNVIKYPMGLQDFEGLITDGYLYVDITAILYRLVTSGKYIFLSRTRNIGSWIIQKLFDF